MSDSCIFRFITLDGLARRLQSLRRSIARVEVVDSAILSLVTASSLLLLFHRYLILEPLSFSDVSVPYLGGTFLETMSSPYPWYRLFSQFAFYVQPNTYGFTLNSLNLFLPILMPPSMYFLLLELNVVRRARLICSLLYYFNPIVLPLIGVDLNWSLYYIFIPLIVRELIHYRKYGRFSHLVFSVIFVELLVQFDYAMGGLATLRVVVPSVALLLGGILIFPKVKKRLSIVKDYVSATGIFLLLSYYPVLLFFSGNDGLTAAGTGAVSGSQSGIGFIDFHLGNLLYTYASQNILYSLTGLTLYPGGSWATLGYGISGTFFPLTLLWLVIILFAYYATFTTIDENSIYYWFLALSGLIVVAIETAIYYNAGLQLFVHFPILFLYEYPFFFNSILAFVYVLMIARLVDSMMKGPFNLKGKSLSSIFRNFHTDTQVDKVEIENSTMMVLKNGLSRRKRESLLSVIASLVVVITLLSCSIPILNSDWQQSNVSVGPNSYQPYYFNSLVRFFNSDSGVYRVLCLPLNYSTYNEMLSAIPSSNLLYYPYAFVNSNPSYFINHSLFQSMLSVFQNGRPDTNLTKYFAQLDVKYVVILNPFISFPITIDNDYINGGGSNFLRFFMNYTNFTTITTNANFSILKNPYFDSPLSTSPQMYTLNGVIASPPHNYINTTMAKFPDFQANATVLSRYWVGWTNMPPAYAKIVYQSGSVSLFVGDNASTTYLGMTEIWQNVSLVPYQNLLLKIHVDAMSNVTAIPFIIFHNFSTYTNFYSNQQYFYSMPINVIGGNFTIGITSPAGVNFAYIGLVVENATDSWGYLRVTDFNLINSINYSVPNVDPSHVFQVLNNVVLLSNDSSPALEAYAGKIFGVNLVGFITNTSFPNLSFSPQLSSLYLRNISGELDLSNMPIQYQSVLHFFIETKNGSLKLTYQNITSYWNHSGWASIVIDGYGPIDGNQFLPFSVGGLVKIRYAFLTTVGNQIVNPPNLSMRQTNSHQYAVIVPAGTNGSIILQTVEYPTIIDSSVSVVHSFVIQAGGFYMIVINSSKAGVLIINFPVFNAVNYTYVSYNALIFSLFVAMFLLQITLLSPRTRYGLIKLLRQFKLRT